MQQVTHWIIAHSLTYNEGSKTYERGGFVSFRADQIICYKPCPRLRGNGTRILISGGEYIDIWSTMQSLQSMLLKISRENISGVPDSKGSMQEHMLED